MFVGRVGNCTAVCGELERLAVLRRLARRKREYKTDRQRREKMTGNDRVTYINVNAPGALVITTGLSRDRCYNVRSDEESVCAGVVCSV